IPRRRAPFENLSAGTLEQDPTGPAFTGTRGGGALHAQLRAAPFAGGFAIHAAVSRTRDAGNPVLGLPFSSRQKRCGGDLPCECLRRSRSATHASSQWYARRPWAQACACAFEPTGGACSRTCWMATRWWLLPFRPLANLSAGILP